ncbi:helix-turn-helix domain-containing protein [Providencia rettgeri]|uniref:helix-turn-helix domain-containing protein n=1 Tax=Providencia sp. TaxID=589 RepID=UPI0024AB91D3|nr:helix-turn-helix transcriptional regulator [Providencia rettgeri]
MKKKTTTYYISQLVGKCLQEYRLELGISGNSIAAKLGISQQQLSRYERGENALTVDVLFKFILILGINFPEFYHRLFYIISRHPKLSRYISNLDGFGWGLDDLKDYYQSTIV